MGLLAVAALSSCDVKEDHLPVVEAPLFHAVIEQPGVEATTKTYVDKEIFDATGSYTIFWYKDDRVSIFYDYTYNQQYKFLDRDGSTAGDFEIVTGTGSGSTAQAIATGNNYAITPYHRDNRCDTQGNLTVVIPERQEYYQDDRRGIGVHLLMVAKDTEGDRDFFFKHVGSYLGVRLRGEDVSVKSITLRGNNGETLAGYPIVSFDDNDDPVMSFDPRDLDNSDFVTMELSEPKDLDPEKYEYFWLTLPAVTFDKGLSLTVKDEHGGTYVREVTKSTPLNRKGFYTLSCDVKIASVPVESITVDPTSLTLTMTETETATLTATVLPENATDQTVTWSSDNQDVATVDTNGVVTAHKSGTANITASAGDKTTTCIVYVVDNVSYSFTLTPAEAEINFGETQTYVAELITTTNGTAAESKPAATLTSSEDGVVTIDGLTVTGAKGGTTTITASFTPEGTEGALTATATLTVKDVVTYELKISPTTAEKPSVIIGKTLPFTLTLVTTTNGDADESDVTSAATWSSTDTSIATVAAGVATGAKEGKVTITGSFKPEGADDALSASVEVTVNKDPNHAGDPTPIGEEEEL